VPLHVAIDEWVAARGLLGPTVGLLEVVRDWKRRHLSEHCEYFQYSSVPAPRIKANNRGEGLPSAPGIYFVWEGLRCVYVGRSANLSLRCILGKHPALKPGDALSWLEEPVVRLKVAEAFYIGTLRPERNFRAARWASSSHETATHVRSPENFQVEQPFVQSFSAKDCRIDYTDCICL